MSSIVIEKSFFKNNNEEQFERDVFNATVSRRGHFEAGTISKL